MVTNDGLVRVFWPSDIPRAAEPGVLLGWRNSERDYVVVTVLKNVELHSVEFALRTRVLFRGSAHPMNPILGLCGGSLPQALGEFNPVTPATVFNPSHIVVYTHPKRRFPQLYCPQASNMTVQVIVFNRPHPTRMQYFSIQPMSLPLKDKLDKSADRKSVV